MDRKTGDGLWNCFVRVPKDSVSTLFLTSLDPYLNFLLKRTGVIQLRFTVVSNQFYRNFCFKLGLDLRKTP